MIKRRNPEVLVGGYSRVAIRPLVADMMRLASQRSNRNITGWIDDHLRTREDYKELRKMAEKGRKVVWKKSDYDDEPISKPSPPPVPAKEPEIVESVKGKDPPLDTFWIPSDAHKIPHEIWTEEHGPTSEVTALEEIYSSAVAMHGAVRAPSYFRDWVRAYLAEATVPSPRDMLLKLHRYVVKS